MQIRGMIAPIRKAPMMKCDPMSSVASAEAIVAAPTTTAARVVTLSPSRNRAVTILASAGRTTRTMRTR